MFANVRAADFFPAVICITFYLVVLFLAEIARKIVDLTVNKKTYNLLYTFLIELIGTAQMCTCVFENGQLCSGIIIKYYGVWGFFFTVASLLTVANLINRGAYVSPLMPIELYMRGNINTEKFLTLLFAESLGGFSAFRLANGLWYYSASYSMDHLIFYESLPCAIVYKVSFIYVFFYELLGAFLLRFVLHRLPISYKMHLAPFLVASFLGIEFSYIGVPGLNPVTASSRLQGCPGLDIQWFIMTYWCCPVVGWLLASQLDRKPPKVRPVSNSSGAKASAKNNKKKNS